LQLTNISYHINCKASAKGDTVTKLERDFLQTWLKVYIIHICIYT